MPYRSRSRCSMTEATTVRRSSASLPACGWPPPTSASSCRRTCPSSPPSCSSLSRTESRSSTPLSSRPVRCRGRTGIRRCRSSSGGSRPASCGFKTRSPGYTRASLTLTRRSSATSTRRKISGVRDELEQAPVRVPEIEARSVPAPAAAAHGPPLDRHAASGQVLHRLLDRALPDEADVAVPRLHRLSRDEAAHVHAGAVHVHLLVAEAVGKPPVAVLHELRADDIAIERVRALPLGDGDDDVVEPDGSHAMPASPCGVSTRARSAPIPIMLTSRSSARSTKSTYRRAASGRPSSIGSPQPG